MYFLSSATNLGAFRLFTILWFSDLSNETVICNKCGLVFNGHIPPVLAQSENSKQTKILRSNLLKKKKKIALNVFCLSYFVFHLLWIMHPVNTRDRAHLVLKLAHRVRRWPNIGKITDIFSWVDIS